MAKKKLKTKKLLRTLLLSLVFPIVLLFTISLSYNLLYINRIFPGISVAGIDLGGLRKEDAEILLKENLTVPKDIVISDTIIKTESIKLTYDLPLSVDKAYFLDRSSNPLKNIFLKFLTFNRHINLPVAFLYDEAALDQHLEDLARRVYVKPIYPSITAPGGQVVVNQGLPGVELDKKTVKQSIINNFSWAKAEIVLISTNKLGVNLSPEEAQNAYNRAVKLYSRAVKFKFEDGEYRYSKAGILKYLNPKEGYNSEAINTTIASIAGEIEREPQNPVFKYENGVVKEFLPASDGIKIETDSFELLFLESLKKLEEGESEEVIIEIPVIRTPPPNRTEDVNSLGIKELIGAGVSYFRGSISSRIHNIGLASSKFNGILVSPGETLSFNKILGDVSQFTGYQQAYIIRDGQTILGDGGGVCQVSTTFFRAALNAGLPILERRAHSYRVGYYEQSSPPGIDATVFDPTTDLKIKNDTANHILIQTKVDGKNLKLTFEIYGTNDGRKAEITKPVVSKPVPPPEDLYIDDPTLPAGQVKQIDWKAWGAKVTFNYKVTREGESLINKTFVSNYQPWQAKYLRGTGPAI